MIPNTSTDFHLKGLNTVETEVFQWGLLKNEKDNAVIQAFLPLPVRMSTEVLIPALGVWQPGDHLIPSDQQGKDL